MAATELRLDLDGANRLVPLLSSRNERDAVPADGPIVLEPNGYR